MEKPNQELINRALDGQLSPGEQSELKNLLEKDPALQQEINELRGLHQVVKADITGRFKPYFATRVMQRIKDQAAESNEMVASLSRLFRKVAIVSAIVVVSITGYNIASHWELRDQRTLLELALNLDPPTIETSLESITSTI